MNFSPLSATPASPISRPVSLTARISLFPNLTTKPPQQSHFHPQSAYRTALLLDRKLWGQLVKRKTAEEVAAVVRLLSVQEIPKQTIGWKPSPVTRASLCLILILRALHVNDDRTKFVLKPDKTTITKAHWITSSLRITARRIKSTWRPRCGDHLQPSISRWPKSRSRSRSRRILLRQRRGRSTNMATNLSWTRHPTTRRSAPRRNGTSEPFGPRITSVLSDDIEETDYRYISFQELAEEVCRHFGLSCSNNRLYVRHQSTRTIAQVKDMCCIVMQWETHCLYTSLIPSAECLNPHAAQQVATTLAAVHNAKADSEKTVIIKCSFVLVDGLQSDAQCFRVEQAENGYIPSHCDRIHMLLSDKFLDFFMVLCQCSWNYNFMGVRHDTNMKLKFHLANPFQFYHKVHTDCRILWTFRASKKVRATSPTLMIIVFDYGTTVRHLYEEFATHSTSQSRS